MFRSLHCHPRTLHGLDEPLVARPFLHGAGRIHLQTQLRCRQTVSTTTSRRSFGRSAVITCRFFPVSFPLSLSRLPPLTLTTNPKAIDTHEAALLLAAGGVYSWERVLEEVRQDDGGSIEEQIGNLEGEECGNQSAQAKQAENLEADGLEEDRAAIRINPAFVKKLRRALNHSTVVAAVFAPASSLPPNYLLLPAPYGTSDPCEGVAEPTPASASRPSTSPPPSPSPSPCLIAMGRAYSDSTLTAAMCDIVVAPGMQGKGLGRRVVQRILSDLLRRGISDISVMPPPDLRSLFAHLGFKNDRLQSITMKYTRRATSPSTSSSPSLFLPPSLSPSTSLNELVTTIDTPFPTEEDVEVELNGLKINFGATKLHAAELLPPEPLTPPFPMKKPLSDLCRRGLPRRKRRMYS